MEKLNTSSRKYFLLRALAAFSLWTWLAGFSGCLTPTATGNSLTSSSTATTTTTTTSTTIVSTGARAAKFIFKQSNPGGSFDTPPSGGTVPTPGSGLQASRVFNADGSLLASGGPTASTWPKWITSLEIGISGPNNSSATNPDCARFSATGEDQNKNCSFTGGTATNYCGASPGLFRVSEYDCSLATPTTGTGGPNDGVYIRATFSRDTSILGSGENIMVVIEYAASALNPAPTDPRTCFKNGIFDSTVSGCADQTWRMFLKHSLTEVVQPFLMLVPPSLSYINTTTGTGGSGVTAKQFYVPLAADQNLQVLQISRISALANDKSGPGPFTKACTPDGAGNIAANSPLCVGMIIYSVTFYRI